MRELQIAGERVLLTPQGCLVWNDIIFVGDLHLDKPEALRSRGSRIPIGIAADDLRRLSTLVESLQSSQLIILGDLFHAAKHVSPAVEEVLSDFVHRTRLSSIELISGNHDRNTEEVCERLSIGVHQEGYRVGPFGCFHHPGQDGERFSLAAHLHPCVLFRESNKSTLRLKCFALRNSELVLPAFGGFTGGYNLERHHWDKLYALAGDSVMEVQCN